MASSTRNILEKTCVEEKCMEAAPLDTSLDISKARLLREDSGTLHSPKTPTNSPRSRPSSPKPDGSPRELKKSPRFTDLTQITERVSPPREDSFDDIGKYLLKKPEQNDGIGRRRSSGTLGSFKVTKKDSKDLIAALKKVEETIAADESLKL